MDAHGIDRLSKTLAIKMTRGRAIKALLGVGAGGALGVLGTRDSLASGEFCARMRRNGRAYCTQTGATGDDLKVCIAEYAASFGCVSGQPRR